GIGDQATVELQSPASAAELATGGDLSLRCRADGVPEPQLEWFLNGVRLFRSERLSFRGRRMHLASLTAADNGIYSCRATSDAGQVDSLANFALALKGENVPRISVLPSDVTVRRESTARLDCVYDGAAVTEWYARDGDVPLTNSSKRFFASVIIGESQRHGKWLQQSGTPEAQSETYLGHTNTCLLHFYLVNAIKGHVPTDGLVLAPINNRHVSLTSVELNGLSQLSYKWRRFAAPRRPTGVREALTVSECRGRHLERIVAANIPGRDIGHHTWICVSVPAVPPSVTSHPLDLIVDEGEDTTLVCVFTGSPHPVTHVTWQHDERPLRDPSPHAAFHPNGTLVLRNVGLTDAGEYRCQVNTTGFPPETSKVANIQVRERLKFVPAPVSRNLELGSNAKVYCKARGSPAPIVRWIKEGQQPYLEWPPHIRDDNGTLRFQGVRDRDAGRYTCIATSAQGLINATVRLDVIVMPRFTVQPMMTKAVEGYSAMLHCKATGDPPPTIQWDRNNVLNNFDPQRYRVMDNGSLLISEVHRDDDGKYGCTAGNSGGLRRVEASLVVIGSEGYSSGSLPGVGDPGENTMAKTVTITLGAAAIYMMLVMGLMIWCRFRRARRKAMLLLQVTSEVGKSDDEAAPTTELRDKTVVGREPVVRSDNGGDALSHSSGSHSQHSKRSRSSYDRLQYPRHDLHTMMLLGRGEFGDVFLAKARGIRDGDQETVVMVKALHSREEWAHADFKREMDMFHKLSHEGITRLLGVSRDVEPFLAIMEYTDWGDLKQFLLATQKESQRKGPKPPPLAQAQSIGVCHQVALAMEHLANHRFTHRDLAARNCLVTSRLDVKVGCPALSRDSYANEYAVHRNRSVPIRWTPAEALFEDEWSTKSDVYSFAVLAWEVFSQGALPQGDKDDAAVLKMLRGAELRWSAPENVPVAFVELLNRCWQRSPRDRPAFGEVAQRIGEIFVDSNV
ncbi:unnamed protein product, partial [Ixodes hexagonus]